MEKQVQVGPTLEFDVKQIVAQGPGLRVGEYQPSTHEHLKLSASENYQQAEHIWFTVDVINNVPTEKPYAVFLDFRWKDQGWGNLKGCLRLRDAKGIDFASIGPAAHEMRADTLVGRIPTLPSHEADEPAFSLHYSVVGGGGGHSLHVEQLKFCVLLRSGI
eukprot:CAMPEP_0181288360 /NCGR_PEP_ID=MMETSP1101-20121128/290_1 /TAXON_ID=46948 /ORGANISM="Rhodomonas abbreviata, Strain Caron Lab Isolate" /LENGTH=160 /DNA_ID=CAMNT_0023392475 /DNA_START=157 /DNA_END=640 /DNA_ORIENTATION=-